MKVLNKLLIGSTILHILLYIIIPIGIFYCNIDLFTIWICLGIANFLMQPILLSYSWYCFFKIQVTNTCPAILLTINTLLFLLLLFPAFMFVCFIFGDWDL